MNFSTPSFRVSLVSFLSAGLFAATLAGCARGKADGETVPPPGPPASAPVAPSPSPATPRVAFEKLRFEKNAVPKTMPHEGDIRDGAKWMDQNGENTLFVTTSIVARGGNEMKIFGYHYVAKGGRVSLLWKIADAEVNDCDEGEGLVSPIEVRDIDDDGVAESLFVYNIAGTCDVSPKPFKLMMHSGDRKYAIRGMNRVTINDSAFSEAERKGKKEFDPAFKGAPDSFRSAASAFWDRYVKPLGGEQKAR